MPPAKNPPKLPATIREMGFSGYEGEAKEAFHRDVASFFRRLARWLDLEEGSWEVRSNKGGPAVGGEVTLHHRQAYLQASESAHLLYRTCQGLRDYSGGTNLYRSKMSLESAEDVLDMLCEISPEIRAAREARREAALIGESARQAPAGQKSKGL